jgi:uncharacterized membrane protein YphA (DoxX/SURF4 family)
MRPETVVTLLVGLAALASSAGLVTGRAARPVAAASLLLLAVALLVGWSYDASHDLGRGAAVLTDAGRRARRRGWRARDHSGVLAGRGP